MRTPSTPDPVDREIRALILVKRLLSLEVRTVLITKLTGVPRNRLAALRRKLAVSPDDRPRGHARWRVETFVATAEQRFASSALGALLLLMDLVDPEGGPGTGATDRLGVGERLVDAYEFVHSRYPEIEFDFEDFVRLRTMLVRRELLEFNRCGRCKAPIVIERNDHRHRMCWLCEEDPITVSVAGKESPSLPTVPAASLNGESRTPLHPHLPRQ
jgi:hypothetical protein